MHHMHTVEIIIPVYNEAHGLINNIFKIADNFSPNVQNTITLIDDGSTDLTWHQIEYLADKTNFVKGVHLEKNTGKESAIFTGLSNTSANAVIVMDSDLQHPPELLPAFIQKWLDGYPVVEGIKVYRGKESVFHKIMTILFSKIIQTLYSLDLENSTDYKLLDKSVVEKLIKLKSTKYFFRGTVSSLNMKTFQIPFNVKTRKFGTSKFSLASKISLAVNALKSLHNTNNNH